MLFIITSGIINGLHPPCSSLQESLGLHTGFLLKLMNVDLESAIILDNKTI